MEIHGTQDQTLGKEAILILNLQQRPQAEPGAMDERPAVVALDEGLGRQRSSR